MFYFCRQPHRCLHGWVAVPWEEIEEIGQELPGWVAHFSGDLSLGFCLVLDGNDAQECGFSGERATWLACRASGDLLLG